MDELRVLVTSGDSIGHLSHAAVILDALAGRHPLPAAVTLPHDARFRSWIGRRTATGVRGFPGHLHGSCSRV